MDNSQLRACCNAVIRSLIYFIAAGQESVSNSATAVILTVLLNPALILAAAVRQITIYL